MYHQMKDGAADLSSGTGELDVLDKNHKCLDLVNSPSNAGRKKGSKLRGLR